MRGALVLVIAVASSGGCDLFGTINCSDDGDCPDAVPFCVEGACAKDEDGGRNGRGVDGGGCSDDSDCENGLCALDGKFVDPGNCLPPADDDTADCSGDPDVQGAPRTDPAAPVIFNVQATYNGDGCYSGVAFDWFQRDPQPFTSAGFGLIVGGVDQHPFISPESMSEDHMAPGLLCGATIGKRAGLTMILGETVSNVACLPVADDGAAP